MTPISDETLFGTPVQPARPGLDKCPARDDQGQCPDTCAHWAICRTTPGQAALDLLMIEGD
jgi:hypothetical protein